VQLEAVVRKKGFASYDEYNNIVDNISLVLGGFDPATKKYVGFDAGSQLSGLARGARSDLRGPKSQSARGADAALNAS
jgi:hypothetical protein